MSAICNGNRIVVWLGLATFAWSMLFVWQGLDFTDMGVWLTGYQQLYTNPDTIWMPCWLSFFIGHWIGWALGGSVLAYRLAYIVVITASAVIAYQLLASQFGRSRTLAAMVLLTVFVNRVFFGNWVSYYELTALFYLAGAALLFLGLVGNRKLLVVLAGVVLGANLFVRFPNLLGITLVSAVWLQAWAYRWSFRDVLVWSASFLGGFSLGVALVWGLIVLHGHETLYFQGIQELYDTAGDADSNHPSSGLLKLFITDHIRAFVEALLILVIGGWIAKWVSKQKILLASVVILTGALLLYYVIFRSQWQYCVPGICYIVLLTIVFLESRKNTPLALLAFIAGMVLLLPQLGSNSGIGLSVFGMWLALPLTLIWLWRSSDLAFSLWFKVSGDGFESNGKFSTEVRRFRVFTITLVLALLFQSLASAWRHTWADSKNRFAMTHSIAHPLLVGTYTTAERAKVVTELLDAMSHFTKPGDEVLFYNDITTVAFLTETHPWLGDPWPDVARVKKIAAMIRQKEKTGARLPSCIVRATGSTGTNSWPIDAQPVSTYWHQDKPRRVFAEFEQRHGYVVAWSNDFFEILTTAQ